MEISVFIREYAPLAGEAGRAFRIDPVVILAQAAIDCYSCLVDRDDLVEKEAGDLARADRGNGNTYLR